MSLLIFENMLEVYILFMVIRSLFHLVFSFANSFLAKSPAKLERFPLVSIIIPCYNEEKVLVHAIQSIEKLNYPNIEIIILDDGSSDQTFEVAQTLRRPAKIRVIYQKNAGKAAALNRGANEAAGEYCLCVDADSELAHDTLLKGVAFLESDRECVAVAGAVTIGNVHNAITSFQRLEYVTGLNLFKSAQSFFGMVTVIPGPVGLFRRAQILAIGGYKSNTFAEDCELTIRLLMKGHRVYYCSDMVARTEAPDDFQSLLVQRYRWSRGVLQAIRYNSEWFWSPRKNFRNFLIISYMLIESFLIPFLNFVFGIGAIEYALISNGTGFLSEFFLQLAALDIVLASYCIVTEKQSVKLLWYALLNRFTYGFALESLRFFALVDELLNLPMSWAKLARKGMNQNEP